MSSSRESDPLRGRAPASGVRHPIPVPRGESVSSAAAARNGLAPWWGWGAGLALFVAIVALVLGTLLQLTHELLDLGHQRSLVVQER